MKYLGYVIGGMIILPIGVGILIVVLVSPILFFDKVLGLHPLWGLLFWLVVFSGAVGGVICHEVNRPAEPPVT